VVVGSAEFSGAGARLPEAVDDYVRSGRLVFLGRISDGELRWMYERAVCLVFLSRDEGFGLPPVEAMQFGTPVLVSDIPVMREVVGSQGAYVSPDSAQDVAVALDAIIAGSGQRPPAGVPTERRWEQIASVLRQSLTTSAGSR
jgi:glycosyltransferase involved in cell wall biosynthesis